MKCQIYRVKLIFANILVQKVKQETNFVSGKLNYFKLNLYFNGAPVSRAI